MFNFTIIDLVGKFQSIKSLIYAETLTNEFKEFQKLELNQLYFLIVQNN